MKLFDFCFISIKFVLLLYNVPVLHSFLVHWNSRSRRFSCYLMFRKRKHPVYSKPLQRIYDVVFVCVCVCFHFAHFAIGFYRFGVSLVWDTQCVRNAFVQRFLYWWDTIKILCRVSLDRIISITWRGRTLNHNNDSTNKSTMFFQKRRKTFTQTRTPTLASRLSGWHCSLLSFAFGFHSSCAFVFHRRTFSWTTTLNIEWNSCANTKCHY